MKKIRIVIGGVRYVVEEVEGEATIRREDAPVITRDRQVLSSTSIAVGYVTVEKIA